MHAVATQLRTLRDELNDIFLERRDAIDAMLLAVLSGQHVFLLGPPGTAKSEMVRSFIHSILGSRYFEILFSKNRQPEAVFGPLHIKEFRENGNYILNRAGFATDVEFAFFDEIGKASAIMGHDLLALMNERIYHEVSDGNSSHAAPLSTAFTASNELITDESDDAAALWDRLLFRVLVDNIEDDENFKALITKQMPDPTQTLDWLELKAVIDNEVPSITMGAPALDGLLSLRNGLSKAHIFPSNRRWRQSVKAIQAQAFLEGRTEVAVSDLYALRFTLWDTAAQIEQVHRICREVSDPWAGQILALKDAIKEQAEQGVGHVNSNTTDKVTWGHGAMNKLRNAVAELVTIRMGAAVSGDLPADFDEVVNSLDRTFMQVARLLDMEDDQARALVNDKMSPLR